MKTQLLHSFRAYRELIQTGGIQSTAEGEHVFLEIKGNLAGDLLVFIGPKNKSISQLQDINELVQSDGTLEKQSQAAFKTLRLKYKGLSLLPRRLIWGLNSLISAIYVYLNSENIRGLFYGEISLAEIQALLPIISITAVTFFLIKAFGLKILIPFLFLVIKGIRLFRKIRNRQIA